MHLLASKLSFTLLFLLGCTSFIGCDKNMETAVFDVGTYRLLQESIDAIPYISKNGIVFVDANQNETSFSLTESDITTSNGARIYRYDVFEQGDTIRYNYIKEIKTFTAQNDDLNMTFEMRLEAQPYKLDPASKAIADVLEIYLLNPENSTLSLLLSHEINTRDFPESFNNVRIEQKEILGELFYNVYESDFGTLQSKIDFNPEFGILSFTDKEGSLWRLKEII